MSTALAVNGSLASAIAGRRLVVLVGQGGVGKTSVSAAVAYARARLGGHVAVLTVDPAPRLGDALGLRSIDGNPRAVTLAAGSRGSLTAMRLDTKRTFDRMVERHAPSSETAEALLAHPVYRSISEQLAGTDSYMAFQRLHELNEAGGYDFLVVDTPPATNAAELLAAPARLAALLDSGALSILADPARIVARAGSSLARATFRFLLAAVERVTGASLQKNVGEFVNLAAELVSGLEGRARDIDALLRSPAAAFVLVTRPRTFDIERALAFRSDLARTGIEVAAVVVNRLTPPAADRADPERLDCLPKRLHDTVLRMEADMDSLRAMEVAAIEKLASSLGGAAPLYVLHARDLDIATIDDVAGVADEIAGQSSPGRR